MRNETDLSRLFLEDLGSYSEKLDKPDYRAEDDADNDADWLRSEQEVRSPAEDEHESDGGDEDDPGRIGEPATTCSLARRVLL